MNIPGFRKGHAPRAFIEKYYGEEVFYEAAIDHLYRPMVMEAVEKSACRSSASASLRLTKSARTRASCAS